MRLLSLNVWGGRLFGELMDYMGKTSKYIDTFCLQEVYTTITTIPWSKDGKRRYNLFSEFSKILPDFCGFYSPHHDNYDENGKVDHYVSYGLAIFVRKNIQIASVGDVFVFGNRNSSPKEYPFIRSRTLQYVMLNESGKQHIICNFHGLWNGEGKSDTEERLEQSRNIRSFLDQTHFPKILCGDFNLTPGTESLRILEKGMKNLITENNIPTTRSSFYPKRENEPYADYVLVSPDIRIHAFKLDSYEASDHLPLFLEFTS